MDPRYRDTRLKLLDTSFSFIFRYLGHFFYRYFGMNKKVRSYPFLVSFFQIGELNLSLGVLGPCYTLEIILKSTIRFLGKHH